MTSREMRKNTLFMKNEFNPFGKWEFPLIKKQELSNHDIQLLACSETKANDTEENKKKGVHFFVDDYRFEGIYTNPQRSFNRYLQYAFLLSPDFSLYADMPLWRQLENIAKNRWVGAYWQEHGLTVIPTVSWSTPRSFAFCFDGIERHSTVAVGMIGCKRSPIAFMRGYNEMLKRLEPEKIIVFGTPFPEMQGNLIPVDYCRSGRAV